MHKWLQLPATPTDDPLATVYPINHYKKSHVYAVTRINPIYVDDEHHGTFNNKSGSSGYDSQPHSDHSSSLDKNSPPATKCLRNGGQPKSPPSDRSSGDSLQRTSAPWLSPIKEGVIDVHQYCIPRPVWPGHDDRHRYPPDRERIPRVRCCRHCTRCRCRSNSTGSSSNGSGTNGGNNKTVLGGKNTVVGAGGSYSGYSSAYGGTVSTSTSTTSGGGVGGSGGTGSCSDDATPSSGSASIEFNPSQIVLDPRFGDGVGVNKALVNNWNSVDLRLNQKTDNLHYDCGAMLRGLQFTLDAQQAEKLMQKIKVGKKHRCWCRMVTACLGLIMFLVSVVTVSLALTRGQKTFGSL